MLYAKSGTAGTASLHKEIGRGGATPVKTITLDKYFERKVGVPDFIKIDTEGHEIEVLRGMRKLIAEGHLRCVQFEFNGHHLLRGHTLPMLLELLPGFSFYRLLPHGMLPIDPAKYLDNIFMYCNVVAIRNDGENRIHR